MWPIKSEGGEEECITNFTEFWSVLEAKGVVGIDVELRVDKVARAIGA